MSTKRMSDERPLQLGQFTAAALKDCAISLHRILCRSVLALSFPSLVRTSSGTSVNLFFSTNSWNLFSSAKLRSFWSAANCRSLTKIDRLSHGRESFLHTIQAAPICFASLHSAIFSLGLGSIQRPLREARIWKSFSCSCSECHFSPRASFHLLFRSTNGYG